MTDDDRDESDETAIQALALFQSGSDATNTFFMRVGEEILTFATQNNLSFGELAVNLGYLAGTFSITATSAYPDRPLEAEGKYLDLCIAGIELGAAKARIKKSGPKNE